MSSLTAIILTKNSAATLKDCLTSVSFCDSVIVADDGSTDTTCSIAATFSTTLLKLPKIES